MTIEEKREYLELYPLQLAAIKRLNNLEDEFTVKDICSLTKSNSKYVNKMVNVMRYLDVIELIGKDGRKYVYKIKKGLNS